jgi:hypothetical protein
MRQGCLEPVSARSGTANFAKIGAYGRDECDKMRQNATFTQKMELYVVEFFGLAGFFRNTLSQNGLQAYRDGRLDRESGSSSAALGRRRHETANPLVYSIENTRIHRILFQPNRGMAAFKRHGQVDASITSNIPIVSYCCHIAIIYNQW